jgi:hypothetical protein
MIYESPAEILAASTIGFQLYLLETYRDVVLRLVERSASRSRRSAGAILGGTGQPACGRTNPQLSRQKPSWVT